MTKGDLLIFINRYKQNKMTQAEMAKLLDQFIESVQSKAPVRVETQYINRGEESQAEKDHAGMHFGVSSSRIMTAEEQDDYHSGMKHFQDH